MASNRIAYFSMEIGLDEAMPTYSGGLGILAGDTLRAAADRGAPVIGVTLLHRKGYFRQRLDAKGAQSEEPDSWTVEDHLEEMEPRVTVRVGDSDVVVRAWRKQLEGVLGDVVPVYFLDAGLSDNDEASRSLTDSLYGGDDRYRLSQEAVLGVGGVRMLDALGHDDVTTYHMNEGHAALLTLELVERHARARGEDEPDATDVEAVREHCVFTTHTPVAAGHDKFDLEVVKSVLGKDGFERLSALEPLDAELNMTELALRGSRYVNGVARRHGEVTRDMFDGYDVEAITNGVHAATWTAPSFQAVFDRHIPGWRGDNQSLRYIIYAPLSEIAEAHAASKTALLEAIRERSDVELAPEVFTVGFARRATAYKRGDMLLRDLDRLRAMAKDVGPLQIVYAGKAHPHDGYGKDIIRNIVAAGESLGDVVRLVYLPDYGMRLGGLLTSGCDIWLNTPEPPKEASGTSGMKAALNGVPSFSVLDGWWLEGHVEGVTGWSIGESGSDEEDLYGKLESTILPLYYDDPDGFAEIRRHAISLNGSFFNTERMVSEYVRNAYRMAR